MAKKLSELGTLVYTGNTDNGVVDDRRQFTAIEALDFAFKKASREMLPMFEEPSAMHQLRAHIETSLLGLQREARLKETVPSFQLFHDPFRGLWMALDRSRPHDYYRPWDGDDEATNGEETL